MGREEMIEYIKINTCPYQGMEDDFEGLEDLDTNELENIIKEIK